MSTAEQIANLQSQFKQSRARTITITENLDKLRTESSGAVLELRTQLGAMQIVRNEKSKQKEKELELLNLKHLDPKNFTGAKDETCKS